MSRAGVFCDPAGNQGDPRRRAFSLLFRATRFPARPSRLAEVADQRNNRPATQPPHDATTTYGGIDYRWFYVEYNDCRDCTRGHGHISEKADYS